MQTRRWTLAAAAVLAAFGAVPALTPTPAAQAQPQPSPVPKRWQLDLQTGPLRIATVTVNGQPRAFYYLTYSVVNNTGRDHLFAPAFDMASDDSPVYRSGKDVPMEATAAIIESLESPFLKDQISIIGTFLQGEENAKYGVAIWPVRDLREEYIQVFAAGFSGETTTIQVPHPVTGQPRPLLLRKTLMLRFRSPGELNPSRLDPLEPVEKRWIMR